MSGISRDTPRDLEPEGYPGHSIGPHPTRNVDLEMELGFTLELTGCRAFVHAAEQQVTPTPRVPQVIFN